MPFEFEDLMFSLESEDGEHVALKLNGCGGGTQKPVFAKKVIGCGGRTDPPLVPGSVPLGRLEDLKSALQEMETRIKEQIEAEEPPK